MTETTTAAIASFDDKVPQDPPRSLRHMTRLAQLTAADYFEDPLRRDDPAGLILEHPSNGFPLCLEWDGTISAAYGDPIAPGSVTPTRIGRNAPEDEARLARMIAELAKPGWWQRGARWRLKYVYSPLIFVVFLGAWLAFAYYSDAFLHWITGIEWRPGALF